MPEAPRRSRGFGGRAVVWKRFDFRESSRVVALLLRDHGIVHALAKGAHRQDSPLLGRLDHLNEVDVQLSPARDGLRLLVRAELVRERRALRSPRRFVAASHFVELCDFALPAGRADAELFDLVAGGLTLLERCPEGALPAVVLGLELRLLLHLGAMPALDRCGECGAALPGPAWRGEVTGAIVCRTHAASPRRGVSGAALAFLRQLRDEPGRRWPEFAAPPPAAASLPAVWLASALERHCRLRRYVVAAARARPAARAVDTGT